MRCIAILIASSFEIIEELLSELVGIGAVIFWFGVQIELLFMDWLTFASLNDLAMSVDANFN